MLKSDVLFLALTIYLAVFINVYNSSMLIGDLTAPIMSMFMALLVTISMVFTKILERQQYFKLRQEIEYYNKIMLERFKNGDRTNKRRR